MKNLFLGFVIAGTLVTAGAVIAQTSAQHGLAKIDRSMAMHAGRSCIFPSGGWAEVDCSAGAAYSAALNKWSRYDLQANTGDAYWAMTTVSTGADADSSDGYLPKGAWVEVTTSDTLIYFSCDGSATSGTVRYIECR